MPRDGSPNPCFAYLQSIGYAVSYAHEALPAVMRGQSRLDALPVAGPYGCGLTACQRQKAELQRQKQALEQIYNDFEQPDDYANAGARLGDLLTAVSQRWYDDYCTPGRHHSEVDRLQDRWIDVIGRLPQEFESWALRTFILLGRFILPDLIAGLLDGEMEYHFDNEYAEFVFQFDEYQIGERITQLAHRLRLLDAPAPLPEVHRPVRPPQCNAQPRSVPMQSVPRLFDEQEDWQTELLRVQWQDMPPDPMIPLVQGLEPRPCFVIVHLFSGRRREHDIHHWLAAWSSRTNIALTIISMDAAISPVLGNLDVRSESWSTLRSLYLQGKSRPQSLATRARRFHRLDGTRHHPSLHMGSGRGRSALLCSFLASITSRFARRKMKQTKTGSAFFLQTLWTLACHLAYGGLTVRRRAPRTTTTRTPPFGVEKRSFSSLSPAPRHHLA